MEKFVKGIKPEAGDMLRVRRKAGYCHFGIATTTNKVVHFTGADGDLTKDCGGIMIRETSLSLFKGNDEIEVCSNQYSKFVPNLVVERARSMVGEELFLGNKYNFITNNCEHFARYIFEGRAHSKQVRNGAMLIAAVGVVALEGVTHLIGKSKNNKKQIEQKSSKNSIKRLNEK